MADSEADVISHLLDVEQNAFVQVKEAQEKANKMVGEARSEADCQFKTRYEEIASELDKEFLDERKRIVEEHNVSLSAFKDSVQKKEKNKSAFENFVKKAI